MSTAELESPPVARKDSEVVLKNVGPISEFRFHMPPSGLVVFRGKQGCGKSHVLGALDCIGRDGKKPSFSVKDRERFAQVSGFGLEIRLGQKATAKGEREIESLKGLDIDELADPGIANPEAADAARIRFLVKLMGVEPDPSLFYDIVSGKADFEALLPNIDAKDGDLLSLAGKIKRGLEAAARVCEANADQDRGKAKGCKESAAGVDTSLEDDAQKLQQALESAVSHKASLDQQAVAWARAKSASDNATRAIEQARLDAERLPSVEAAKDRESAAIAAKNLAADALDAARKALAAAEQADKDARAEWLSAVESRSSAESRAASLAGWQTSIDAATKVPAPSEAEIESAAKAVADSRRAVETGALIRKAKDDLKKSDEHLATAKQHAEEADRLRTAAGSVDGVLSGLVSRLGGRLRVEADRLVTDTPERGKTLFSELSDGQRYEIAIDMVVEKLGSTGGLATISQRAYGEIQPKIKLQIAEHARKRGVLLCSAEVTDDESLTAVAI